VRRCSTTRIARAFAPAGRGPEALWQRFGTTVAELKRVGAGTNLVEVARARELLVDVAGELAAEIERQDLASGVLGAGRRQRCSA
jgi:hypothetical protein